MSDQGKTRDQEKYAAALRALDFVQPNMRLGLGTGSTAAIFVDLLAERVERGLKVLCVPTSERTREQAHRLGIALTTLDETPNLDLTVDGADEFDSKMRLIKGGGGALLREKIVAAASNRMVVITDRSKQVSMLGRFPLPVEVVPFGLRATINAVERAIGAAGCTGPVCVRKNGAGHDFVTDGGHNILDCSLGSIPDPEMLTALLLQVPGVVETGLFLNLASAIIVAGADGVQVLGGNF